MNIRPREISNRLFPPKFSTVSRILTLCQLQYTDLVKIGLEIASMILICRSDRFAEDKSSRDLRHDTVMSLPEWPRQLLGNAFGKERVDDREGIVRASNKQKRKPHTKQVKETQVNPKTDQETESWVEEDDEKIENPPKSHMQGNSSALS